MIYLLQSSDHALGFGIGAGAMLVYLCFGLAVYFIPSMVAHAQKHRQFTAIFMLNLFAGWTFLGWVGALVWAFVRGDNQGGYEPRVRRRPRIQRPPIRNRTPQCRPEVPKIHASRQNEVSGNYPRIREIKD